MAEKPNTLNETRTIESAIELRDDSGIPTLVGYAATFNQEYDLGTFREVVDPAAFNRTLGTQPDVRLLIDHEGQPLARTKSGTLTLTPDHIGLRAEAQLDPSDPDVQRLLPKMRRGDLDQMSFAFRVPPGGDSWSQDYGLRTLQSVELNGGDVSVVTYPANPTTSVSIRAMDQRSAQLAFAEHIVLGELRMGKAISADTLTKLKSVLDSLAGIDGHLDEADIQLDEAMATMSDLLGVPNPDAAEEPEPQANSTRPLGLVQRIARSLDVPAV